MKAIEIEGIDPEVVKKLDAIELGKAKAYILLYDPDEISLDVVAVIGMNVIEATGTDCIPIASKSVKILRLT